MCAPYARVERIERAPEAIENAVQGKYLGCVVVAPGLDCQLLFRFANAVTRSAISLHKVDRNSLLAGWFDCGGTHERT
jgi:hypothetical protein